MSWADMADEDDLAIPIKITKHGVKVIKTEVKKKDPPKNNERVRDLL